MHAEYVESKAARASLEGCEYLNYGDIPVLYYWYGVQPILRITCGQEKTEGCV